jgi:nucleotide-binding universal stress UspA family protein
MKVLIAVDSSKFSDAAVDAIANRPWWGDTELLVLSVVPVMVPNANDFSPHYHELYRIQEAEKKSAKELVDHTVSKLKEALPYCAVTGTVEEGHIIDFIITKASQWGADIIVLGSHGRKGFSRLVLGSVAEAVVNRAPCSVEIIKVPALSPSGHSKGGHPSVLKMAKYI